MSASSSQRQQPKGDEDEALSDEEKARLFAANEESEILMHLLHLREIERKAQECYDLRKVVSIEERRELHALMVKSSPSRPYVLPQLESQRGLVHGLATNMYLSSMGLMEILKNCIPDNRVPPELEILIAPGYGCTLRIDLSVVQLAQEQVYCRSKEGRRFIQVAFHSLADYDIAGYAWTMSLEGYERSIKRSVVFDFGDSFVGALTRERKHNPSLAGEVRNVAIRAGNAIFQSVATGIKRQRWSDCLPWRF